MPRHDEADDWGGEIPAWVSPATRVLNVFLREGPLTATEAARRIGMRVPAVWNYIKELETEGVLVLYGRRARGRWGRVPKVYDVRGRG